MKYKKWFILLIIPLALLITSHISLADTTVNISTTVPGDEATITTSDAGTIHGWTVNGDLNCYTFCAGAGASAITVALTVNGTIVSTSTAGTGYSPATSTVTGISVNFSAGDILGIECTWAYECNGIEGTLTGTSLSPEISFIIPINTSTPRNDFTNWNVELNGIDPSSTYNFTIQYNVDGVNYAETDSWGEGLIYNGVYSLKKSISLLNPPTAFNSSTPVSSEATTTWDAVATLYINNCSTDCIITSSSISFVINNNGIVDNTNGSTTFSNYTPPVITSQSPILNKLCPVVQSWLDWPDMIGNGICTVGNYISGLFGISEYIGDSAISSTISLANGIFPLNIFVAVNTDIATAKSNVDASGTPSIILNTGNNPVVFGGAQITLYTSSTLHAISDGNAYTQGFDYKSFFDKLLYLITGLFIISVGIGAILHIKNITNGT